MAFSFNIYVRFAIMIVGILAGIILWSTLGFWYGIWFLLIGLVFIGGYLFLGTVQSAAQLMEVQDFEGVENRLNMTLFPDILYKTNRAYYYLLKGTAAMQQKKLEEAEQLFLKADSIGLPSDQEKGMVQFQLASMAANKNNWTAAKNYYNQCKQYKVTEPQLKEQMKQFEQVLKNKGAIQMGRMQSKGNKGGFYQPGGKRRRPKMR